MYFHGLSLNLPHQWCEFSHRSERLWSEILHFRGLVWPFHIRGVNWFTGVTFFTGVNGSGLRNLYFRGLSLTLTHWGISIITFKYDLSNYDVSLMLNILFLICIQFEIFKIVPLKIIWQPFPSKYILTLSKCIASSFTIACKDLNLIWILILLPLLHLNL